MRPASAFSSRSKRLSIYLSIVRSVKTEAGTRTNLLLLPRSLGCKETHWLARESSTVVCEWVLGHSIMSFYWLALKGAVQASGKTPGFADRETNSRNGRTVVARFFDERRNDGRRAIDPRKPLQLLTQPRWCLLYVSRSSMTRLERAGAACTRAASLLQQFDGL
jgi:hypothetical protein